MITYKLPDGKLPPNTSVYITPVDVTEASIRQFKLDLIVWHNNNAGSDRVLLIDICSNGGNVNDAISLRNTIQLLRKLGHTVIGRVSGRAWSCASWLLQACDYRIVADGATLMFHEPRYSFDGTLSKHKQEVKETEELLEQTIGFLLTHTDKIDRDGVMSKIANGSNWFITGPDAVKLGLADEAE
jgi:ATP-dependent protease ClpP protease subunit